VYTPNNKPVGRPTKKTKQIVDALLKVIATGAPYTICCASVGINLDTFMHWKKVDQAFASQVEQVAAKSALRLLNKIEEHGNDNFAAAAWILERRFPADFSRPEVQLNLIQQNNVTENHLSITISGEELREIESTAQPVRESVRAMFERYRLAQIGNVNSESSQRD
jgi:hypothetical protein